MKVKPKFKKNKHTRTNLLNNKYLQKKYLIIVGVIFVLVAAVLFASTRVTGKGALAYDACSAVGGTYKSACGEGEIENTSVTDASSASSSDSSPSTPGSNTPGSKTPGSSAIVIKTPTKIANKCCVPECIYNGGACALACADEEVDLTGPGHSCKNNAYSMASFKCCAPADAGPEELPDCESIPGQECVLFPFCAKDNKISDYNCGFLQTCCAVEQEGPACGNMHLDPGEVCDFGNLHDDDGCDSNCNYWSPITPESTCPGDKTGDVVRENEQKNCMGILTTHSKTMMGGNLDTDTYVCCVQTCYFYAEREDTFGADCLEAVFDPETGPACAEGYLRDPVGSRTGSEPFCLQPEPPLLDTYLACCERDPCYDHGGFFPVDEPCEATPGHREILVEALNELPCCIPDIPCPTDEDCWCAPDNLANIAFVRANEYSCDSPLAVCWCPPDVNADAGPTCTDTDSEETDPYSVKGTATYTAAITGVETIADDVCASVIDATEASNKLIEYYCDADNNGQSKEITCSSDCQDGACVDEAPLVDEDDCGGEWYDVDYGTDCRQWCQDQGLEVACADCLNNIEGVIEYTGNLFCESEDKTSQTTSQSCYRLKSTEGNVPTDIDACDDAEDRGHTLQKCACGKGEGIQAVCHPTFREDHIFDVKYTADGEGIDTDRIYIKERTNGYIGYIGDKAVATFNGVEVYWAGGGTGDGKEYIQLREPKTAPDEFMKVSYSDGDLFCAYKPAEEPSECALGNVNGDADAVINVLDLVAAANLISTNGCDTEEKMEEQQCCSADVTCNGEVNVLDLVALANAISAGESLSCAS